MNPVRVQRAKQPASRAGWNDPGATLPADLIQNAALRLAAFARLVAATAMAYAILEIWGGIDDAMDWLRLGSIGFITVYSSILGFSMRRITLDAWQVYWIGLIYLISIGFVVSITRHSLQHAGLRGWSAAAVLSLLFPVLVPCSPKRAALAASAVLVTALTAFGLTRLAGLPFDATTETVRLFMGEFMAIPMAGFVSSVVYGLGRELESARRLGAYELDEVLGRGGMGEVWRGHHSLLARPAAIKLIRTDAMANTSPEIKQDLLKRFEREAQATAALKCPHTVSVFDFGISDDGTFYYVMELLDGIDLHDFVARHGAMPVERVVEILKQACRSLSEAHGHGMVHRDIKPSNIVICRLGEEVDFVKILDFGLVTPSNVEPPDGRLTSVGQIAGTPAFISPEQGRGDLELDGRSDLYGLGCVAYWLLTSQVVFEGSSMEMLASHINEAPRPVSIATLTPIPEALENLVMQCLEKDPSDRPRSAREILQALDKIDIERPWTQDRATVWWNAHAGPRKIHGDAMSTIPLPEPREVT